MTEQQKSGNQNHGKTKEMVPKVIYQSCLKHQTDKLQIPFSNLVNATTTPHKM